MPEARQNNASIIDIPINPNNAIDDAQAIRYEINHLLQQFSEWMRVASETKRMELLYILLLKDSHETSDLFGMVMEIARRIMLGEEVSIEEMRFLSDQNPQLLFVVVMLKEQPSGDDEKERRRARERRRKDRRAEARKQAHNLRSHRPADTRGIESINLSRKNDLVKDKQPTIAQETIKNIYDSISKRKQETTSIDELITGQHDIAT